jgi:hypothetical protein
MGPCLAPEAYARFLADEYLSSYIKEGGAAVKVAVCDDEASSSALASELRTRALSEGYQTASIDAAATKIHLIQNIFFGAASQLDWTELTRRMAEEVVISTYGSSLVGVTDLPAVVDATGMDPYQVKQDVQKTIRRLVVTNYALAKDFRLAMTQLLLAEMEPEPFTEQARSSILDWLHGELRLISALKECQIYHKIARHNARTMLESTARWSAAAKLSGLCVIMDWRQLAVPRKAGAEDERVYYTPGNIMDGYEVLRQFIDATDDMDHLFILVMLPDALLDEDPGAKRSVARYPALKTRIWEDVRDKSRPNPCAPMVHVAG